MPGKIRENLRASFRKRSPSCYVVISEFLSVETTGIRGRKREKERRREREREIERERIPCQYWPPLQNNANASPLLKLKASYLDKSERNTRALVRCPLSFAPVLPCFRFIKKEKKKKRKKISDVSEKFERGLIKFLSVTPACPVDYFFSFF